MEPVYNDENNGTTFPDTSLEGRTSNPSATPLTSIPDILR